MGVRLIAIYVCLFGMCNAQINYRLIKHLDSCKLYNEESYYLDIIQKQHLKSDSTNYLFAKFNLKQHNDSLFFKYYALSASLYNSDTSALQFTNYYFLKHPNPYYQKLWFNEIRKYTIDSLNNGLNTFYNTLIIPANSSISINARLANDLKNYNKLSKKSPFLAGCLSTMVPGLGKLYGQRPNSALLTFFSQSVYAFQSIESVKKYGIKNSYSIFSISFFSLFYLSNIYGSYIDLKSLKKQRKKQLLLDAEKYFNLNYPATLY